MINVASAESLIFTILLVLAYFLSVTITGYLQTRFAVGLGDNTAQEMGYESLNPFDHIELIPFLVLIIFKIGWPTILPFNPTNIYGNFRLIKLFLYYCFEPIVYGLIAFISLAFAIIAFGYYTTTQLLLLMLARYNAPVKVAIGMMPHASSNVIVILAIFLIALVFLSICMSTVSLIYNAFEYMLALGAHKGYEYMRYADFIRILGPILILILFGGIFRNFLRNFIMWCACKMALLLGVFHL